MSRRSFLHGALVLMAAALVTRVMGFVYRIVLTRLIGASGMGLFQIVFPILGVVLTFVTAGLPVAISKLVAEALVGRDRVRVARILRVSSGVILSLAVLFTLLMWFARGYVYAHWLADKRAYPTYLAMIPLVGIISIASIYRGYFQGLQDMGPTAWSSILEQTVRITSIWIMASFLIKYSVAYAAAAAMVGMVLGELAGLAYLMVIHYRRARLIHILPDAPTRSLETTRQTLKAIGEIAVPVTFSRLIGSVIYALEPILVTRALAVAGVATTLSTALYGQYSGMAIPLLIFPTVFTGSLTTNLVPSVSEAMAGDERHRVRVRLAQSWQATAMVGFPTTVILTVFAEPLCRIIFKESAVGQILAIMAPAGFLLYLQGPLSGILQGLNRAGIAMTNSIIGGVVRLGLIYVLASEPHLKILGVAWAVTLSVCFTTVLHFVWVYRFVGFAIRIEDTVKMAVASLLLLALYAWKVPNPMKMSGWQLLADTVIGLIFYFVLLCAFRVLRSETVQRIPKVGPWLAVVVKAIPFGV